MRSFENFGRTWRATDDNILRRMRFAWWTNKATDTHSEYVILIFSPRLQWLRERVSMLRYSALSVLLIRQSPSRFLEISRVSWLAEWLSTTPFWLFFEIMNWALNSENNINFTEYSSLFLYTAQCQSLNNCTFFRMSLLRLRVTHDLIILTQKPRIHIVVFCVASTCKPVAAHQHSLVTYCLHLQVWYARL